MMISILINIIVYGFLGTGVLGIVVGVHSKYGILGIIRLLLGVFAVPAWLYVIYRVFGNLTHVMSNHLQEAGDGLFDVPFVISIVVIAITSFIGVALNSSENKR